MWRNWNPVHSWWGWKMVQLLWKTVWRFLNKLKTESPHDPAFALLYTQKNWKQGLEEIFANPGS